MKKPNTFLKSLLPISALILAGFIGPANASSSASSSASDDEHVCKLISTKFEPRQVVKIEAGKFHFKPGQPAPVHTHVAPAIGYIVEGSILYQVEGQEPQLLRKGDAFYEPAGPRILHFDNASANEEAIFIDINLQQEGEPFIVFEQPLTEEIDRRMLPTANLNGDSVDRVNVYAHTLKPGQRAELDDDEPVVGYVAEGSIELRIEGKAPQRFHAGESFFQPVNSADAELVNSTGNSRAKVIIFKLRHS